MGLPNVAEDLVICCWALQTGHAFQKGEVLIQNPAPGDLKEDLLLRPVALPDETAWKQALERSKGLFGVHSPTALLNVGNVSEVCKGLRERVVKWLPASSLLEAELDKAAPKLGLLPRQSQRAKTNQEALELLKAMQKATGDIALVTVLATHSLTSLSNPLSLAMSKADGVAEAMRRIPWPLVDALVSITDGRNAAAQTILGALREGFERDEYALAFAPRVEEFTKDAASLLALAQVVEPPPRREEVPPVPGAVPRADPIEVVLPEPAVVAPRNKRSQAKGDSVAAWVPQDFANYTLVEVTVQTVDGASQALVLTANTARLIEQSGDAVYDPKAKLLRFAKWNFSVEIDPEGAA